MKNYTWTVEKLLVKDIDDMKDYVVDASFDVSGTEEVDGTEYSYTLRTNNASFKVSEGSDFISFEDLTNEIVVSWIKEMLGPQGVADYEAAVGGQIDAKINPPVVPVNKALPW
jgi:hypothetical protein